MKHIKFKIWVEDEEEMFLGNGRVHLLEAIGEHGSITAAAKSMQMSYKKAWEQIDHMNAVSKKPLVETLSGGKGGGGTVLTLEGEKLVHEFKRLTTKLSALLNEEKVEFD